MTSQHGDDIMNVSDYCFRMGCSYSPHICIVNDASCIVRKHRLALDGSIFDVMMAFVQDSLSLNSSQRKPAWSGCVAPQRLLNAHSQPLVSRSSC